MDDGQRFTVRQGDSHTLTRDIPLKGIEWHACQGRSHLQGAETSPLCCLFTMLQDQSPQTFSRPLRVHKDGPDFCRVGLRIQKCILTIRSMVASEKRFSIAPSPASDDQSTLFTSFGHKIRSIFNELGIQTKRMAKCSIDLRGGIIILLEPANGLLYQAAKGWNIHGRSLANHNRSVGIHAPKIPIFHPERNDP